MSKSKSASVEIPSFQRPLPPTYNMPGLGRTSFSFGQGGGADIYGFNEDPQAQAERLQIEGLKKSILVGLGVTAPEREVSLNQWQDIFTKEAMRTSMPQLEQTLFQRGLGGSRFYQDSVNDLLSKIATQSVLGREGLRQADEATKLQQLSGVSGLGQQGYQNIYNLLGLSTQTGLSEEQAAQQRYLATLPFLSKVNAPQASPWGTIGTLAGAGLGFALGGPVGAGIGSSLGGGVGGMIGGSPSQIDLSSLAMLQGMGAPLTSAPYTGLGSSGGYFKQYNPSPSGLRFLNYS